MCACAGCNTQCLKYNTAHCLFLRLDFSSKSIYVPVLVDSIHVCSQMECTGMP